MSSELPDFWKEQAELLEIQAQQFQVQGLPEIDLRFMSHCNRIEGDTTEQTLFLQIEGDQWRLIRRAGAGVSWEIHSPDQVIAFTSESQVENRLDREILDYRARLLTHQHIEQRIKQRIAELSQQLWTWPSQRLLTLYFIEWEGFKKDESGWTHTLVPDEEGFVTVWQGSLAVGILLSGTTHFIKRYQFRQVKELSQEFKVQRNLTIPDLTLRGPFYVEAPGEALVIPIGVEPVSWIIETFKGMEHSTQLVAEQDS